MGYLLLAVVASAGFLASVICHLMGWLHMEPPWGKSVFVLHVGFLVLWFPLVIFATRTMPKPGRGNLDHLLAELPKWVRSAVTVLFVYALLNFAYFMYCTSQYPKHEVPFYLELRGFSGHWMMFYGIAAIGFVALSRLAGKRRKNESIAEQDRWSQGQLASPVYREAAGVPESPARCGPVRSLGVCIPTKMSEVIKWQGKAVRVQARYVPRFLWTTASIDVLLGDQCILRTGGQLKLTGSYSTAFSDGGSEHQIELSWGHSSNFCFPYQLRIDGVTVDDSHVQVENRYMIGIPAIIIVALLVLFFSVVWWLMTTRSDTSPEPAPVGTVNSALAVVLATRS
jgi:hypothetical protein